MPSSSAVGMLSGQGGRFRFLPCASSASTNPRRLVTRGLGEQGLILGIDIGSSSVKAALLATDGEPRGAIARRTYAFDHPTPDAVEFPAERLWEALVAAVREAAAGHTVSGIGLSCLTPALVVLGADDRPLAPVWTHLDRRSRPNARATEAEVGEEFLHFAGCRPLPGGISAVCWARLREERPELADRVRSFLHLNGWLGLRLTGEKRFDPANASFSGLFDTFGNGGWSERWCTYFLVDKTWLPPVISGDAELGRLRPEAAAELGVSAGVPVKLGTADTTMAMLAAGCGEADLLHVVGTTQVLMRIVCAPRPAPERLVRRLGVGDRFVHVTHNPVGGAALEWVRELCFRDVARERFYDDIIPAAVARASDVRLDPPFLGGDRLQIEESFAALTRLSLWSTREDILSAVLAAMRREHEAALRDLECPEPPRRIFVTGGGAAAVRRLLPYAGAIVLEEGSLRGTAALFSGAAAARSDRR